MEMCNFHIGMFNSKTTSGVSRPVGGKSSKRRTFLGIAFSPASAARTVLSILSFPENRLILLNDTFIPLNFRELSLIRDCY